MRLQQKHDNRDGTVAQTYSFTTTKSKTTVHEVTVTTSVSVSLEAGFELFGSDIKISSTFDYTKARQRHPAMAAQSLDPIASFAS